MNVLNQENPLVVRMLSVLILMAVLLVNVQQDLLEMPIQFVIRILLIVLMINNVPVILSVLMIPNLVSIVAVMSHTFVKAIIVY